jgi:large subunit ribosomal protein L22
MNKEKKENKGNEKEIISATSKYIRVSPSKIDNIIVKIRGKSYKEALQILKYLPQKTGAIVWQTLYSAISNATNNFDLEKENLIIKEAFVNQGPILKRMRPRAQGRAFAIQKKMSHLTIRVSEI